MRFAISDGGVILTEENSHNYEKKRSLLTLNPYNSSLYKMAVISRTPIVYIEKATDRLVNFQLFWHENLTVSWDDFEQVWKNFQQDRQSSKKFSSEIPNLCFLKS